MNVRKSLGGNFYWLYRRRRLRSYLGRLAVLAAPAPARDLGGQVRPQVAAGYHALGGPDAWMGKPMNGVKDGAQERLRHQRPHHS
jgi:hypothetical protein